MIIKGQYMNCNVFCNDIEQYTIAQAKQLCDNECFEGCKMALMPDAHPGKVSPIGTIIDFNWFPHPNPKLMPMLIGNDIGCGLSTELFKAKKSNLVWERLDKIIKNNIPTGNNILDDKQLNNLKRLNIFDYADQLYNQLNCKNAISKDMWMRSLGTLGSGNHFIEIGKSENNDDLYSLAVHSGSRSIGARINLYYMELAEKRLRGKGIPFELLYLEGNQEIYDYTSDVITAQAYANLNRAVMIAMINKELKINHDYPTISSAHNTIIRFHKYIGSVIDTLVICKGSLFTPAIASLNENKDVMIPINMKEGMLHCKINTDKINDSLLEVDSIYGLPHGSGRIMNRSEIKNNFTLSQYKKEMKGIYSPTIDKSNLDEAPFAYRGLDIIKSQLEQFDYVSIEDIYKPIYVYKHSDEESKNDNTNKCRNSSTRRMQRVRR